MSEADHQAALMRWARTQEATVPELKMLFCIANGGYALSKASAWHLKQRGVRPGVPDLCLAVARGGYHGLYVEMKDEDPKKTRTSPEQKAWIEALRRHGYAAIVCLGWIAAKTKIERYLALLPPTP